MSTLGHIFLALEQDIHNPVHKARFMEARCRHQVLADQPSVESLIRSMGDQSRRTLVQRDQLTLAMVAEYQNCRHPFWSSVLLVVYQPMLKNLRRRIRAENPAGSAELNQLVITGFLNVLDSLKLRPGINRLPSRLLSRTKRWVFTQLRQEWQAQAQQLFARSAPEHPDTQWPDTTPQNQPMAPTDVVDAVCLLVDNAGHSIDGEAMDLLTHTMILRKTLSSALGRLYPEAAGMDADARKRLYGRTKRRHSRLLQTVREALADLHPTSTLE